MKLLRVGAPGAEKPALLDPAGTLRDLSAHLRDIDGAALAPASLAPPPWRGAAIAAAFAFTLLTGGWRMALGAHFLSDVAAAWAISTLVVLGCRRLLGSELASDGDQHRAAADQGDAEPARKG